MSQSALSSLCVAICLPCLSKAINQVWCHFTTTNTKPWKINTKHQQMLLVQQPPHLVEWLCNRKSTLRCLNTVVVSKLDFVRLSLRREDSFVVVRLICVDDGEVTTWHFLRLLRLLRLCEAGWQIIFSVPLVVAVGWKSGWGEPVGQPGKLSFVAPSGKVAFFPTMSTMSLSTALLTLCLIGIVALWTLTSSAKNAVLFSCVPTSLRINAIYVLFK